MGSRKYFTLWISLACISVFIIQQIFSSFTENFALTSSALTKPWQFITAIFLHGSLAHLFYNLLALILFGLVLESLIGSRKFLFLFLISGTIANLISFSFYPSSLGASGAIMAIIGTLAVLRPGMAIWAFNLPMPMFMAAIIWTAGSFMGIFGFGDQSTGYIAHLSGIILGIMYGFYLRLTRKNKQEPVQVYERKFHIPETNMRIWEDFYIKK